MGIEKPNFIAHARRHRAFPATHAAFQHITAKACDQASALLALPFDLEASLVPICKGTL